MLKDTIKKYYFGFLNSKEPYESRVVSFLSTLYFIILIIALLLMLSGCSSAQSPSDDDAAVRQEVTFEFNDPSCEIDFTIIYRESFGFGTSEIFYDNYTKVLYYMYRNNQSGSLITPLYNADGSLRTYEE